MIPVRPGGLRIIGGRWGGRRLPVPAAQARDSAALRPTPDRVRETVFNWLQSRVSGAACLDLCAGSGVLGFEAVSRGAASATLVEQDPALCRNLRRQAKQLNAAGSLQQPGQPEGLECPLRVVEAEARQWLRRCRQRFDIVFLDPPYRQAQLLRDCCRLLSADPPRLTAGGLLYLEHLTSGAPPSASLRVFRHSRAGRVHFFLLQYLPS